MHGLSQSEILAPFFLLVGIQLRGEITHIKQILLPSIAAMGGMAFPAFIYLFLNRNSSLATGWPVVMPTDIALVMVVLLLLGKRASVGLKTFMLAVAVADDLFSIFVIGVKYSGSLKPTQIAASIGCVGLGVLLWKIPFQVTLTRVVNFIILPTYIVANLYLTLTESFAFTSRVGNSIIVSRVIGKAVGILLFAWLASRLRIAEFPFGLRMAEVVGGSILAGMGLAVSFMIANLTFIDVVLLNQIRVGLFNAAVISGVLGALLLWLVGRGARSDL